MTTTLISQDIVQARQKSAPRLDEMRSKADNLISQLEEIKSSALVEYKPAECDALIKRLSDLRDMLKNKYELFNNGVITVSVAGIEKSGKTTLLKNLTGIEALPTDNRRCTSVSCEIIYVESPDDEGIVGSYYTQEQLIGIVQRQIAYLKDAGDIWEAGRQFTWGEIPKNLDDFANYKLPSVDIVAPSHRSKYKSTIEQLEAIYANIKKPEARKKLATSFRDSLASLPLYASHVTKQTPIISDYQPIIRKITVYKNYEKGCPSLRLNDTPGVDDPNPHAFNHTMQAIKSETDLLVVANRPKDTPDMTGPLADFLSKLSNLDPASPIRKRTIFFVNWHKEIDPDGTWAKERIEHVKKDGTFQDDSIYGPCNIMEPVAIRDFLNHINERLARDIPVQDKEMLERFESEWKDIREAVRTHVYKSLREQMPPLPEEQRLHLSDMYDRWFKKANDTEHPETPITNYFMDSLIAGLGNKTRTCTDHESIKKLNSDVTKICMDEMKEIREWLTKRASIEECKALINANSDPRNTLLPELGERMTKAVEKITGVAEDISPVIQKEVYKVIAEALQAPSVAAQLCPGDTPAERLMNLCRKMKEHALDDDVKFIVSSLGEFANIEVQMRCLMRHELRPALNLFDPLRWTAERKEALIESVATALDTTSHSKECLSWIKSARILSIADTAEEHSSFYENLCKVCFIVIHAVMLSNANKFEALMQDFMADASQTLATQRRCENGWHKGLRPFTGTILADEYRKMEQNQANAQAYANMLEKLDSAIG